jgi:transcriptional regulator with XRE-family HTH domain
MTDIDKEAVGKRIRALREALGISQQTLGERCGGASITTVNRWERGRSEPQRLLPKLAEVLGVKTDYLLYGEPTKRNDRHGGGDELKTLRVRKILSGPAGKLLTDSEREAWARALAAADDVEASTVELIIQTMFASRKK